MNSPKRAERSRSTKKSKAAGKAAPTRHEKKAAAQKSVHLRLYVAGRTPKSVAALNNLKRICDEHMPGEYNIEIIDLMDRPQLARGDQIVAIPTVVKNLPTPIRKLIGDMSNSERVIVGLDLRTNGG